MITQLTLDNELVRPTKIYTNLKRYFSCKTSVSFWHLSVRYNKSLDYRNPHFYYLDFSKKLEYKGPFDDNGIPMLDYKGDVGVRYNPSAIAQYGLGALYDFGKTEDGDSYDKFFLTVDWLAENLRAASEKNNLHLWLYDFDLDAYSVKAPWASALAQGLGISVLMRAYGITGKEKYAMKGVQAFQAFLTNVEDGGIRRKLSDGVIFEEVPTRKPSCILDGFIFSLFGLMDLYTFNKYGKAIDEFNIAIETMEKILPQYDMKFWSRADLYSDWPKMIASPFYHKLHIYQLDILYGLTGKDSFKYYSGKWNDCLTNELFKYIAIFYKAIFKVFYY